MGAVVFVTQPLPDPGVTPLIEAGLDVRSNPEDRPLTVDELLSAVVGVDAVVTTLSDRIDGRLLDAGTGLKVVANLAVGFDNIDVAAARRRGVEVTTTPDVLSEATADLAWALLLAASRRLSEGDRLVRSGRWSGPTPRQLLGQPVGGRTLGIVGMGAIGQATARRAKGFSMSVVYFNRNRLPEGIEQELGARYVSLEELLTVADVVSLHAPLNDDSHHLIDAAALARMKPTAVLVNTARGPLVDEVALVAALREGRLAAAGLDVYEGEPQLVPGLADLDNVVLAPHIGSATIDTRAAMVQLCMDNVIEVLAGRPALTPAPQTA